MLGWTTRLMPHEPHHWSSKEGTKAMPPVTDADDDDDPAPDGAKWDEEWTHGEWRCVGSLTCLASWTAPTMQNNVFYAILNIDVCRAQVCSGLATSS